MGDVTCVFGCDAELVLQLERELGPPIDSYLNGWQVWVQPAPAAPEVELEWRLHPPHGFSQPRGLDHHDLWDTVVEQLVAGADVLRLGEEERRLDEVWFLLEVYAPFGDELLPDELRAVVEEALDRPATAAGEVDHRTLGARWKRTKRDFDLPGALLAQLGVDG
ncbi:MAG: hypothetical protein ACRDUY_01785 [Nitriliruptorales bacterium]